LPDKRRAPNSNNVSKHVKILNDISLYIKYQTVIYVWRWWVNSLITKKVNHLMILMTFKIFFFHFCWCEI
jgi:hypothetical protein